MSAPFWTLHPSDGGDDLTYCSAHALQSTNQGASLAGFGAYESMEEFDSHVRALGMGEIVTPSSEGECERCSEVLAQLDSILNYETKE